MAYGAVDRQTWNDEKFRSWDRDTRDVWLYLLTCPHGNRIGCFVLDPLYVASDVQIGRERASECLEKLDREGRIVWDPGVRVVCIVRHLHPDYNPLSNQNVVKAAVKDLKNVPKSIRAVGTLLWAVLKWGRPHYDGLEKELRNRLPKGIQQAAEGSEEGYAEFTRAFPDPDPDPDPGTEGSLPTVEKPSGASPDVEKSPSDEKRDRNTVFQKVRGRLAGAIREHVYDETNQPPDVKIKGRPWSTGRDLSICKQLIVEGHDPYRVEDAICGYGGMIATNHEEVAFATEARRTLLPIRESEQQGIHLIDLCASWWHKHAPVAGESPTSPEKRRRSSPVRVSEVAGGL